jgi:NADH-quinone oxidoreductase subunit G
MTIETKPQTNLINLTINGVAVTVPKGTTVYTAARQLGVDVPIFCYHDRMPPFGACRMCLVEVEKMPKLQTSCTLEATEGMVVKTQSEKSIDGRNSILELLLINHPLDCPICDRGGECPLQENALHYGPGLSRFFEEKRRFVKPYSLGPTLMLDRERCIVCARCTRFGELVASDSALVFIERGFKTEVGTPDGKPVQSKFIGNTISICPVGALTSQVYRFRARPWDNDSTNSTCTLCPVGCSLILDARDGEIMRTRALEDRDVNDVWLCDKGWFGYEYTTEAGRLQKPLIRRSGKLQEAGWDEAFNLIASKWKQHLTSGKLAGLGGNPLTFEDNYLFQQLFRKLGDVNHLDYRVGMTIFSLDEEGLSPGMEQSIGSLETLDYAVLFGLDITEEFPVIWLRLKQAINRGAKVLFFGHFAPEVEHHLAKNVLHAPGQELEVLKQHLPYLQSLGEGGKKGAFLVGRQYLSSPLRIPILSELTTFKQGKSGLSLNVLEGRGNSVGARLAGLHPELGPFGKRLDKPGLNAWQVIQEAAKSGWGVLHVAGADPAAKLPKELWMAARSKLDFLVVQDLFMTETAVQADVVLPALSYVEKGGHFINIERRIQQLQPGKLVPETIYSDGEIFQKIANKLGQKIGVNDDISTQLKPHTILPGLQPGTLNGKPTPTNAGKKGSLLATFAYVLFDKGNRMKHNPHVIQLVKEPGIRINPLEASSRGLAAGDRVKITANGKSIVARVIIDRRVADGTVVLPIGFEEIPVYDLDPNLMNGLAVELSAL